MKNIITFIIIAVFLASCEKEINIDLNSSDAQYVIDGMITDEPGPYYVTITKSVNFSDSNDYPPITDALVIISDNTGVVDTLTESSDGIYHTKTIVGTPGNKYNLSVSVEDKSFFASCTMPLKVEMNTLKFEESAAPGSDDYYFPLPEYKDPDEHGNRYRFLVTVNGELQDTYFVFNDNISNGMVNTRSLSDPDIEIAKGDVVSVEMRCIDDNTYTYFYTLSQISGGGPGGGTTPSNPPNNITGDYALGIFSAHTTQTLTEYVP